MPEVILGLVADTHVPDRKRGLDARVLSIFADAHVSMILHAGDVSTPRVFTELEQVAPVLAVRGNTDWFGFGNVPLHRTIEQGGRRIGLTHGHISWANYLRDKLTYLRRGPQSFDIFVQRALHFFPEVDVVVFGHTHEPLIAQYGDKWVVNPGSACCQVLPGKPPSVGLLHLSPGAIRAEIKFLP